LDQGIELVGREDRRPPTPNLSGKPFGIRLLRLPHRPVCDTLGIRTSFRCFSESLLWAQLQLGVIVSDRHIVTGQGIGTKEYQLCSTTMEVISIEHHRASMTIPLDHHQLTGLS
jgi:hypothetical protein